MVIPRLPLVALTNPSPLPAGLLQGTLIFNTAVSSTDSLTPGFYYWDGSKWQNIINQAQLKSAVAGVNTNSSNGSGVYTTGSGGGSAVMQVAANSGNVASGTFAHSSGYMTSASGNYATAFGQSTVASGTNSFSSGYTSGASGNYATATGQGTQASGTNSFASGFNSVASGTYATAMGNQNSATGTSSFAAGFSAEATGNYSVAIGNNPTANRQAAVAMNISTAASGIGATAFGNQSSAAGNYSFVAGDGATSSAAGSGAISMGHQSSATGNYTVALGEGVAASGDHSQVYGNQSVASGSFATAIGSSATASGERAVALGYFSAASGQYSTAIGRGANTNGHVGSIALADGTGAGILSSAGNQLAARFQGGYRFQALNSGDGVEIMTAGNLQPIQNNGASLGTANNRWSAVYSTNGVIQTSDVRYKTNILPLAYGLTTLMKMRPVQYEWKEGGKHKIGFVAQELKALVPEVVETANDEAGTLGVNYGEIVSVLVKSIQDQQAQIERLQAEIIALKKDK